MAAPVLPGFRPRLRDLLRPGGPEAAARLLPRAPHALTQSTRVAIRAAVDLLGLAPGDEVLVPAWHCGSEIDPLLQAGLIALPYPVPLTTEADPAEIAARITPRTRAVYVIHYLGFPQPHLAAIRALCDAHRLALIEDCALSLLSEGPAQTGRLGDVAVFCFYKAFPVPGGGALVVNRPDLAPPVFAKAPPWRPALRHLGQGLMAGLLGDRGIAALKSARRRGPPALPDPDRPAEMPQDYRFDPDLAGMGISALALRGLAGADPVAARAARRRNFRIWARLLAPLPGLRPLFGALPEGVCPLNMPVLVADRDRIAAQMLAEGYPVIPWWAGHHPDLGPSPFAEARRLKDGVLALPVHPGLEEPHLVAIAARLAALLPPGQRFQLPE